MPKVELPTSKYLQIADMKKLQEKERVCKIVEAPTESSTNKEMLRCIVFNDIIGEKEIYDFKNKFRDFFEAFGDNTDVWVDKLLVPILPEKESLFFVRFEPVHYTETKIETEATT